MWTIACIVGPASFALLFKSEESAKAAQRVCEIGISGQAAQVEDDFGQLLAWHEGDLKGYLMEDLEQSKLARVEFALHQQRTTILAQKAAESDTIIRNHKRMQGPASFDPMGGMLPPNAVLR
jgi:hypothetical protein